MKFNKGDKVKVTSSDGVYTTYLNWLSKNSKAIVKQLPHWVYGRDMTEDKLNDEWTVIHSDKHRTFNETLVFIDNGKEAYLIDEENLIPYPEEKKQWTDFKVGDIITNGKTTAMVVVSSSESYPHIFIGYRWIADVELNDWEKVEK